MSATLGINFALNAITLAIIYLVINNLTTTVNTKFDSIKDTIKTIKEQQEAKQENDNIGKKEPEQIQVPVHYVEPKQVIPIPSNAYDNVDHKYDVNQVRQVNIGDDVCYCVPKLQSGAINKPERASIDSLVRKEQDKTDMSSGVKSIKLSGEDTKLLLKALEDIPTLKQAIEPFDGGDATYFNLI
jgi:hypothetical protein